MHNPSSSPLIWIARAVMAGLVPAIHVFLCCSILLRGLSFVMAGLVLGPRFRGDERSI